MNHGDVRPATPVTGRNPEARAVACREVERGYSHDYLVAEADSPEGGLEELQRLAVAGEVGAILAAFNAEDPDAIEFLAAARRATPRARRAPYSLETSLPGVFAIGDVRRGWIKRMASGVGSEATAVQQAHQYLRGRDGQR